VFSVYLCDSSNHVLNGDTGNGGDKDVCPPIQSTKTSGKAFLDHYFTYFSDMFLFLF
jgi:hypothetical protein